MKLFSIFAGSVIYISMGVEVSFCELRTKMVINVVDGKALGRIGDIVFSRENAKVAGFVVPGDKGFHLWGRKNELFIPYDRVMRIGLDAVLVELRPMNAYRNACDVEIRPQENNCLMPPKCSC